MFVLMVCYKLHRYLPLENIEMNHYLFDQLNKPITNQTTLLKPMMQTIAKMYNMYFEHSKLCQTK